MIHTCPTATCPTVTCPTATCPTCHKTTRQHKAGCNHSGSPRHQCQHCRRTYTTLPKQRGYSQHTRHMALKMYVEGNNFRRIARLLQVSHQTVVNWVNAAAARLPAPLTPAQARRLPPRGHQARRLPPVDTLELDELYTFVGQKKSRSTF